MQRKQEELEPGQPVEKQQPHAPHSENEGDSLRGRSGAAQRRAEEQEAEDGRGPAGRTDSYPPLIYENENFEKYYRAQEICPEEEWPQFMETLRTSLPAAVRINKSAPLWQSTLRLLKVLSSSTRGREDEVAPLPWIPDQLAWQWTSVCRCSLRKNAAYHAVRERIISEDYRGSLTRQEAVSMLPCLFLGVEPHHRILDMCASPGSKTTQLLDMLQWRQQRVPAEGVLLSEASVGSGFVIANDVDVKRAQTLTHQCARVPSPGVAITCFDATCFPLTLPDAEAADGLLRFDRVLADVPCSGDGTLRKNGLLWRTWKPDASLSLHCVQLNILQRGLQLLRVGGRLVYSTCSMNPLEDEAVVAAALQSFGPAVELLPPPPLPGLRYSRGKCHWRVPVPKLPRAAASPAAPEAAADAAAEGEAVPGGAKSAAAGGGRRKARAETNEKTRWLRMKRRRCGRSNTAAAAAAAKQKLQHEGQQQEEQRQQPERTDAEEGEDEIACGGGDRASTAAAAEGNASPATAEGRSAATSRAAVAASRGRRGSSSSGGGGGAPQPPKEEDEEVAERSSRHLRAAGDCCGNKETRNELKFFESYQQVDENSRRKIRASMFPPAKAEDLHLDYAVRVLPQQNNSGGFFVACFYKRAPAPVTAAASRRQQRRAASHAAAASREVSSPSPAAPAASPSSSSSTSSSSSSSCPFPSESSPAAAGGRDAGGPDCSRFAATAAAAPSNAGRRERAGKLLHVFQVLPAAEAEETLLPLVHFYGLSASNRPAPLAAGDPRSETSLRDFPLRQLVRRMHAPKCLYFVSEKLADLLLQLELQGQQQQQGRRELQQQQQQQSQRVGEGGETRAESGFRTVGSSFSSSGPGEKTQEETHDISPAAEATAACVDEVNPFFSDETSSSPSLSREGKGEEEEARAKCAAAGVEWARRPSAGGEAAAAVAIRNKPQGHPPSNDTSAGPEAVLHDTPISAANVDDETPAGAPTATPAAGRHSPATAAAAPAVSAAADRPAGCGNAAAAAACVAGTRRAAASAGDRTAGAAVPSEEKAAAADASMRSAAAAAEHEGAKAAQEEIFDEARTRFKQAIIRGNAGKAGEGDEEEEEEVSSRVRLPEEEKDKKEEDKTGEEETKQGTGPRLLRMSKSKQVLWMHVGLRLFVQHSEMQQESGNAGADGWRLRQEGAAMMLQYMRRRVIFLNLDTAALLLLGEKRVVSHEQLLAAESTGAVRALDSCRRRGVIEAGGCLCVVCPPEVIPSQKFSNPNPHFSHFSHALCISGLLTASGHLHCYASGREAEALAFHLFRFDKWKEDLCLVSSEGVYKAEDE